MDEWRQCPSKKLDTLAQIVRYHLKLDNRAPLSVESNELVHTNDNDSTPVSKTAPDKLVVFSAFPSNLPQVIAVLKIYGIDVDREVVCINGRETPSKRNDALERFKSPRGPRICIISGVGITGLNLQVANIMILIVSYLHY
jgi:SNF2 family DNA or RNA helicase